MFKNNKTKSLKYFSLGWSDFFRMASLRRLFPLQITKRFYLWMVFLIITPIIILAVITQLEFLNERKVRRQMELYNVTTYLDKRLPGSYMEILQQKDSLDKPVDEQIKILNRVLQPIIDDVSLTHPNIGMGYYSSDLDYVLAIGPEFDISMLRLIPEDFFSSKIYETGEPELVYANSSIGWKGKPVLNLSYPIYRNGKIIGHTWANVKLEDVYAEAWSKRWKILITGPIIAGAVLIASWAVFRRFKRDLKSFANAVVHDSGELPEGIMPEFKPLLDEVQKHTKELKKEITERKQVEMVLERYRQITDNMLDMIKQTDMEGIIQYASPSHKDILGYEPEELLGRSVFEFSHPGDKNRVKVAFQRGINTSTPGKVEYRARHANGQYLWVNTTGNLLFDNNGLIVGAVFCSRDVTERKRAEEALKLSEERFSKAFNASPVSMLITSLDDGTIIDVNENFLHRFSYRREEVIGHTTAGLKLYKNIDDRAKIVQLIQKQGSVCNSELIFYKKSGDTFIGLYSGVTITLFGRQCIFTVINDITELRQLQKEMARLDRLNLVGEMAAGIGHEVRNPMTTVRGFLQLLARKEECSKHNGYFELMIEELDRANSIIAEFLSLAKNKAVQLKNCNLREIVENLFPLIQADALITDKYIILELVDVPPIPLDEKEIRQLILNLARNGLESMSPGGKMNIRTFLADEEIVLAIQDDGKGIAPEVLEKIGTPFYTTKENGTGLGLAICYSIAERHNAKINVETSSHGTTFYVRFNKYNTISM